jgi:hypothetical protein
MLKFTAVFFVGQIPSPNRSALTTIGGAATTPTNGQLARQISGCAVSSQLTWHTQKDGIAGDRGAAKLEEVVLEAVLEGTRSSNSQRRESQGLMRSRCIQALC